MRRLVLVACLLVCGCRKAAPTQQAAPAPSASTTASPVAAADAKFWSWFGAHASEVATIKTGQEPIASQLAQALHDVDKALTFEVGDHELVVSADGVLSAFPVVKRLVAAAPTVPGWKITAFRPRKHSTAIALGDGTTVSASDLSFKVLSTQQNKIDVEIYVKGFEIISDPVKNIVFLHLDATLGEYDVETYVGGIELRAGGAAPKEARPIGDLATIVDGMKPK